MDQLTKTLNTVPFETILKVTPQTNTSRTYQQITSTKGGPIVRDATRPPPRQYFKAAKQTFSDPRFEITAGKLAVEKFYNSYDFLKEAKQKEVEQLQQASRNKKLAPEVKSQLKSAIAQQKDELKKRENQLQRKSIVKSMKKRNFFPKESSVKQEVLKQKYEQLEKSGKLESFMASKKKRQSDKLFMASKRIKKSYQE